MKKVFLIRHIFNHKSHSLILEKKAYFAGGCFWCMEESFDQTIRSYFNNFWLFWWTLKKSKISTMLFIKTLVM